MAGGIRAGDGIKDGLYAPCSCRTGSLLVMEKTAQDEGTVYSVNKKKGLQCMAGGIRAGDVIKDGSYAPCSCRTGGLPMMEETVQDEGTIYSVIKTELQCMTGGIKAGNAIQGRITRSVLMSYTRHTCDGENGHDEGTIYTERRRDPSGRGHKETESEQEDRLNQTSCSASTISESCESFRTLPQPPLPAHQKQN